MNKKKKWKSKREWKRGEDGSWEVPKEKDDRLEHYLKIINKHKVMTGEEERDLARRMEEKEVQAYREALLEDAGGLVNHICTSRDIDRPRAATALLNCNTPAVLNKLANDAAVELRGIDADRCLLKEHLKTRPNSIANAAMKDAIALRNEFVEKNLRLVVMVARRRDHADMNMVLADLIEEGNLGLLHAISRFDYRRGIKFSTYGIYWIRHAISRAIADKARVVRIPVHMLDIQQDVEKKRQKLTGQLGRQPEVEEVSKETGVPVLKLLQMGWYLMTGPTSMDRPVQDGDEDGGCDEGQTFGDTIVDPASEDYDPVEALSKMAQIDQVRAVLKYLTPIEQEVLRGRFCMNEDEKEWTFDELGAKHGVSRERIRQVQNVAIEKMKIFLGLEQMDWDYV